MTTLIWDVSTAYDLFISIDVLHDPARYGLRGAWAAGVRSRLNPEQREVLQTSTSIMMWPTWWLSQQKGPKDAAFVLRELEALEPAKRIELLSPSCHEEPYNLIYQRVSENGQWNEADKTALLQQMRAKKGKKGKGKSASEKEAVKILDVWANASAFGDHYLDALKMYYKVFFREEEGRILGALQEAKGRAELLAKELPLSELLEELSQGLRFPHVPDIPELLMIPSFWVTPLSVLISNEETGQLNMFMFGGRPANMSLVPGDVVPDALFQALKALADPTRLRIMRYLSDEPMTPAELARRLRLRAPTVIHHLHALRLARLVHLTFSEDGRRYDARREAVTAAFELLESFLDQDEKGHREVRQELSELSPA